MKAKIIKTGEVFKAKYFKDLSEEEMNNTILHPGMWNENDIFLEPDSWDGKHDPGYWQYMTDDEVEIISEDSI